MNPEALVKRWQDVQERIRLAALKAGRLEDSVRLVAVSKRHPVEAIATLYEHGQYLFGENYVQEAQKKMELLPSDIQWHFLGHLQTNKVKQVVGIFDLIHGVDSLKLARSLQGRAEELDCTQNVLVQVNLGSETQKNGVLEEDLPQLAEYLAASSRLCWQGLMLMPPFLGDVDKVRPFFVRLRELAHKLSQEFGMSLKELSMGMTDDFEAAIEEGATIVRVGTRIFGKRE
ncbi:MAG: YggS family pyridoxal phosphate-dependent enzyme [Desulfomicrobium sp.]|jgi:pyridoxal phosphate enzyme (YggS family)|nr:YggS family pyridoxal phosphate-dependent enzyme [Desulfomicrobium sp.]NLV97206.1 YggS family pyridoxal phosphate-dependent enzyme [Desulfovibrionales bacterium]